MEALILGAVLKNRSTWEEVKDLLDKSDLPPLAQIVWDGVQEYYERDEGAKEVNKDTLKKLLETKFSNPKHLQLVERLLESIPSDVSAVNVLEAVRENHRSRIGLQLASALSVNNKPEIERLLECYHSTKSQLSSTNNDAPSYKPSKPSLLLQQQSEDSKSRRIMLSPRSLNDRLSGGCSRGHAILVYARPETGKTLFLVNLVACFLAQTLKVLYLGNEEPLKMTEQRVMSRLLLTPISAILSNATSSDSELDSKGYGNLYTAHEGEMSLAFIEKAIKDTQPDVVIIDQMRNITTDSEGRVQQLETIARKLRSFAAKYNCLMIYTTQAGDSASNKLVLEQGDVDFSNTGIPGAVDLMIGIGMNHDYENMGQRMLSLPKNKISGDHSYFPVAVDVQLNKVSSI